MQFFEETTLPVRLIGSSHAARLPVMGTTRLEAVFASPARTSIIFRSRSTAFQTSRLSG
jgi:hypothetical protein